MNNEDTLISKLISETCDEGLEQEELNAVSDLRNYFERKVNEVEFISINDYLSQNNLEMSELLHQDETQCYRLVYNKSILDFPTNWSIFEDIKLKDFVYINDQLDNDFLLDIFSELTGEYKNLALIKENGQLRMVFLSEETSFEHIEWFRSFFEKKNQQTDFGAA